VLLAARIAVCPTILIGLLVGGCSASPEKVCNHMKGLLENEKPAAADIETKVRNCTRNVQKAKDQHPERWAACAQCSLDAQAMEAFNACADTCDGR
jgi:hypothetical protein